MAVSSSDWRSNPTVWIALSCVNIFLCGCFAPMAIVALVLAIQSQQALTHGEQGRSDRKLTLTKRWMLASLIVTLLVPVTGLIIGLIDNTG